MIKEKKGSMTMSMLVTIIILVIGFVIVFYFFVMFDWTGRVDKEVCHQSVIYRATLPSVAGMKGYVPLKCKTNKIRSSVLDHKDKHRNKLSLFSNVNDLRKFDRLCNKNQLLKQCVM